MDKLRKLPFKVLFYLGFLIVIIFLGLSYWQLSSHYVDTNNLEKITKYENINLHIVEQECINYPKDYFHNIQEAYFVTQNPDNELLNTVIELTIGLSSEFTLKFTRLTVFFLRT